MEAKLVALFVPARGLWTLKLLAGRLVEMEIVERISEETVRKTLKKEIKPWLKHYWCIPPHRSAQFVAAMEDVLDIYQRDFVGDEVLVCMDETSRQQTKETRIPRLVWPGQPEVVDYEYKRNGTANLFMAFAPNENWRTVKVTDRRGTGRTSSGSLPTTISPTERSCWTI